MGPPARLLLLLAIVLSLSSISSIGLSQTFPAVPVVETLPPTTEPWYPSGPAMDALTYPVFADSASEFAGLQANPAQIDFTDWPLTPPLIPPLEQSPNFLVTSPVADTGYFELEFHMLQNFWGCQFNFGSASCGVNIRQAFAHGLDKNIFVQQELSGSAFPIDNPVPPSVTLNSPNPCNWDSAFPQTGSNCKVDSPGGTAYHLAGATIGTGCTNTPQFAYTPGCGTPDFCAAADHMIAAGLAAGKNPTSCVLTGLAAAVVSNTVNIFIRSDDSHRLVAGESIAQFICGVFTGSFTVGCGVAPSSNNILSATIAPASSFPLPCFETSCCALTTTCLNWWVYTAGFGNVLTFDSSLYFGYDSRFVSGISSIIQPNGPCSSQATPSASPFNYMYLCSPTYDNWIEQAEFAPCLTAPGDPVATQVVPTYGACPGTSQLSAASAAYHAQDVFGQNAFTIPWWSGSNQFAYLAGWQRAVVDQGNGFRPPGNFFTMLDAWNPTPQVAGTIRQGFSQSVGSVNPFNGQTLWDQGVDRGVYDTLGIVNPANPQVSLDWMTVRTDHLTTSNLNYAPPAGTVAAVRFTLRNDLFWHTGQKVTAWDVAFSYIAFKANGASVGSDGGLGPMNGVKVLSPTQVDIDVNATGPFTTLSLSSIPIIPGRLWSTCTASIWDAGVNNMNFATANSALTPCIAPASSVTPSGVITPKSSSVDPTKVSPSYDPIASGIFVGSGPWMCQSTTGVIGTGCTSSGTQSVPPGGSITLKRYGLGQIPGGSLVTYFRSSGNTALWIWSGASGVFSRDFLNFGAAALCFEKPQPTPGCANWTAGIANPDGTAGAPATVGLIQVAIVERFVGVNWVSPFDWRSNPPQGIAIFPPTLHEGSFNLAPGGCTVSYNNGGGYIC